MVLAGLIIGLVGMQEVKLSQGMVIRESVTVAKADFLISGVVLMLRQLSLKGTRLRLTLAGLF
ncbi:hypothetical protein CCB80_07225 [Armatimonadetes bacterium Uphvl-Ar1]|nr:hypothetical protein CCB80_07225 [Armatimonadetes bacterium Uphvl-Ar1]